MLKTVTCVESCGNDCLLPLFLPLGELMKQVRSVERALDVLRSFALRPSQTAGEIQKITGLNRPTLYRLLATLEGRGFIRSHGDPRIYEVSEIALQLANAWLSLGDVTRVSTSHLRHLWDRTGETVALILPHGQTSRILVQEIRSPKPLSLSLGVGHVAPLDRGTSGKVLLAFLGEARIKDVLGTISVKAVRERVAASLPRIRRKMVCTSHGEVLAGGASIASPVFGRNGEVVAAVTVFGPDARLRGAELERCEVWVRETADAISKALGHTG